MNGLFLVTGLICAALLPVFTPFESGAKGILYYVLIVLFAELVLAYAILSYAKYRNAKVSYLLSRTIVSWETDRAQQKEPLFPYAASMVFGVCLTIALRVSSMTFAPSLLIALAAAFSSLGWMQTAQKRIARTLQDAPSFVLSHNGLIYKGKAEVFNGYSKGILKAVESDGNLCLTVLRGGKTEDITLPIPEDKQQNVTDFLSDMKDYFDGQK